MAWVAFFGHVQVPLDNVCRLHTVLGIASNGTFFQIGAVQVFDSLDEARPARRHRFNDVNWITRPTGNSKVVSFESGFAPSLKIAA